MTSLPLSRDAATVVGLAGSALAYAQSTDEEVERWLRPLRLYGEAAAILQGLAIGEAPLTPPQNHLEQPSGRSPANTLADIGTAASEFAAQRGMPAVSTIDLLVAVMRHYPEAFERALVSRGSDHWELVDRLAGSLNAPLH
jgi:hypothetical protein